MARTPRRYRLGNLGPTYLAFRSTLDGGRELLSLIPDTEEQHPFDVASAFVDSPNLTEVDFEGELVEHCCEICGHAWSRHDPEDGCCDAHDDERLSVCRCGRDMAWMHSRTAALSRMALGGAAA
jgi:hypothetical protein